MRSSAAPARWISAQRGKKVWALTHEGPDGDAVGSLLAAGVLLRHVGCEPLLLCPDPVPAVYLFLTGSKEICVRPPEGAAAGAYLFLDCGTLERTGPLAEMISPGLPSANIDHHRSNTGFAALNWVDPCASSAGELLAGCKIKGVYELMPFSTGLLRNVSQCLEDYGIPLYLSHTVAGIYGQRRLEAVEVSEVDENLSPLNSSREKITCDTLLLSVGLIPENELSKTCGIEIDNNSGGPAVNENLETSIEGVFSCGNSLFVNDLVDNVTEDGYFAAENAAVFLNSGRDGERKSSFVKIIAGENIAYIVPQKISGKADVNFRIRAKYPLKNAYIEFGETGFKKKLKFVNPGEMIFIKVSKDIFDSSVFEKLKNTGKSFMVNIREGGQ